MAAATGSLAFIGASRFQGFWDATNNDGTGSNHPPNAVPGAVTGVYGTLFDSTSTGGGYNYSTGLTASTGDFWQVRVSGTTNVNGVTSWAVNDWVIRSGSVWRKLAFEDTIASILVGDLSKSSTFHLTASANKHVLFISGTTDATVRQSGSTNFMFDHNNNRVVVTGAIDVTGPIDATSFTASQGILLGEAAPLHVSEYIYHSGDADSYIRFIGDRVDHYAGGVEMMRFVESTTDYVSFNHLEADVDFHVFSATGLAGNSRAISISGSDGIIRSEYGLWLADDKKITFGYNDDATIEYDEDGTNELRFAGAAATFEQAVTFDGNVTLGDAAADVITTLGELTASARSIFLDNVTLGNAATDVVSVVAELTASARAKFNEDVQFDANVTFGNAATDVATVTSELTASGRALFSNATTFNANVTLGNAATDVVAVTSEVTASGRVLFSNDALVADDKKLYFGTGLDGFIEYDEAGTDFLVISGSTGKGIALSGTYVNVDGKLGVGVDDPDTPIEVYNSSTQQKWSFDSDSYATITVSNGGNTTIASSETGDITLDSGDVVNIDGAGGIKMAAAANQYLVLQRSSTAPHVGDAMIQPGNSSTNIVFQPFGSGDELMRLDTVRDRVHVTGALDILGNVTSSAGMIAGGSVLPSADATHDLGSASKRWANIYTGDLHLRNERGNWTIVEEEEYLSIINNKNSKKYKFVLEEIE